MGFKFINSREYRELCERIAFLEADVNEKQERLINAERELENSNSMIKQLKKTIVGHEDREKSLKDENKELAKTVEALRVANEEMQSKMAMLAAQCVAVPEDCPKDAEKPEKKPAAKRAYTRKTKKS